MHFMPNHSSITAIDNGFHTLYTRVGNRTSVEGIPSPLGYPPRSELIQLPSTSMDIPDRHTRHRIPLSLIERCTFC